MRASRLMLVCCSLLAPGAVSAQSFQGPCKTQILCKGVEPGGGRLIDCLRQHQRELTTTCRLAIADFFLNKPRQGRGQGGGPGGYGPGGRDDPDGRAAGRGPGRDGPYGGGPDDRDGPGRARPGPDGPYRGGPDERAGPGRDGPGPDGRGADRPLPYNPRDGARDPDQYDPEAR